MTFVALAATHHDPDDLLLPQATRVLPILQRFYGSITILDSPQAGPRTRPFLRARGVEVREQPRLDGTPIETLGTMRLAAVQAALASGADHVHLCDWDRVLHWAESYREELADVVEQIPRYDLLILGRTARAFASHPRAQRDTEAIVNRAFGLAWGQALDVTAASRGLSRRAVETLAANDPEPSLGNDCTWPLVLAQQPDITIGYAATEGLEWETPDRFADAIEQAGGLDAWIAHWDSDVAQWAFRSRIQTLEIAALGRM